MLILLLHAVFWAPCAGQMFRLDGARMIEFTAGNPYERFADGRPKVPAALLDKIRALSVDHVYEVLRDKGYPHQFAGGFQILHPGRKLVGRAVTAQYLPLRPDLEEVLVEKARNAGVTPRHTQKVIDLLEPGDVPVVDLMGAAPGHNFGGDNLHAAIWGAARTGAVVEGTIRDLEGITELPSQVYYRAAHPAAVAGVSVIGINVPVRIGEAIAMPGDVVLGDRSGVVFIPPHLVGPVLARTSAGMRR